jgi:hypothetical protein
VLGQDGFVYGLTVQSGNRQVVKVSTQTKARSFFDAKDAVSLALMPNGDVALVSPPAGSVQTMRVWTETSTGAPTGCDQTLPFLDIFFRGRGLALRPNGQLVVRGEGALRLLKDGCAIDRDLQPVSTSFFATLLPNAVLLTSGLSDTYFASVDYAGGVGFHDYGYTRGAAEQPVVHADGSIRVAYNQMSDKDGDTTLLGGKAVSYDSAGKQQWTVDTGVVVDTQPTLGADGTLYLVTRGGKIWAIAADGSTRWTYDLGETANDTQLAIGVSNMLYVATQSGKLIALGP